MMGPPPGESLEERAARWITYVRRETTTDGFRPGRRRVKVHHPDLALWLADLAEQALSGEIKNLRIAAGEAEALAEIVQDAPCVDESHHTMEADLADIRLGLNLFFNGEYRNADSRNRMAIALLNDIRRIVQ
jgi:hypothetical protein